MKKTWNTPALDELKLNATMLTGETDDQADDWFIGEDGKKEIIFGEITASGSSHPGVVYDNEN